MRIADVANANVGVVALAAVATAALAAIVLGAAFPVLGAAVVVPVLLAIARRPQVGVLVLVLLVPFDGLLELADVPAAVEAWKEVLVGVVLVATFVCPLDARAPAGRRLPGWLPALAGFFLVGLLSAAVTHGPEALIGLKINYFYVLLALAIWRCPLDARERDRLVSILMVTGVICAAGGLAQQAMGAASLDELGFEYNTQIRFAGDFLRSFSTFASPFPFAFYLMLVLLVCVPVALGAPRRLRNRLFLLVTPLLLTGLFTSFVRASVLGLGAGLAYLGVRRYRWFLTAAPLAVVTVLSIGVLGGSVTTSFTSGESFGQRQRGWEENFVEIARHPFGNGIGTTGAAAERAIELGVRDDLYNPDNYYFKTLYELGVLGLWMLLLLVVAVFASTRSAARSASPRDGPLLDGIGALVLGAAVASLVANFFDAFPLDVDFWALVAVAATLGAASPGDARDPSSEEAGALDA